LCEDSLNFVEGVVDTGGHLDYLGRYLGFIVELEHVQAVEFLVELGEDAIVVAGGGQTLGDEVLEVVDDVVGLDVLEHDRVREHVGALKRKESVSWCLDVLFKD